MTSAFVDTTVLADRLLKPGPAQDKARVALARYATTRLPVYAIKELILGPLAAYVWLHNKLVQTKSYNTTLGAIKGLMAWKRNMPATALEVLTTLGQRVMSTPIGEVTEETVDVYVARYVAVSLRNLILMAWRQRRSLFTEIAVECHCFPETEPEIGRDGRIELGQRDCKIADCAMGATLRSDPTGLAKLEAVARANKKLESQKRAAVLKDLIRKPKAPLDPKGCRNLGDAIFAYFADDADEILTTNLSDHRELAAALGKKVSAP